MFIGLLTEIMLIYQTAKIFAIAIQILTVIVFINSIIGFIAVIRLLTKASRKQKEKNQIKREETYKQELQTRRNAMLKMEREITSLKAKLNETEKNTQAKTSP